MVVSLTKSTRTVSDARARTVRMVLAAMMLALCLVLPFITAQIPQVGSMLLPMHLPVLLCGLLCGPNYALLVGLSAPFVRFLLFGLPTLIPSGLCMSMELAAYGFFSGLLYHRLNRLRGGIWLSLILSMLAGRAVWLIACLIVYPLLVGKVFTFSMFLAGAFLNAWPGILLQLVLVPVLMRTLKRILPL